MTPQTTLVRARRILRKLAAFSFSVEGGASYGPDGIVGIMHDLAGSPLVTIFENGVEIRGNDGRMLFADMEQVRFNVKRADEMWSFLIPWKSELVTLEILTKTGKYRDVYEFCRFMIRCIEDHSAPATPR